MSLTKTQVREDIAAGLRSSTSYSSTHAGMVKDVEKWMREGGYAAKNEDGNSSLPPHDVVGHYIHGNLISLWEKYKDLPE